MRCRHCGDPIEYADFGAWVDENGLRSCAPKALRHEPDWIHDEAERDKPARPEPLPKGVTDAEARTPRHGDRAEAGRPDVWCAPCRNWHALEPCPLDAEDYARWRATTSGTEADYIAERER